MGCLSVCLISTFGYIALGIFLWRTLGLIWQLIRPAKSLKSFGSWTVITGGTDGIGKAMCFELAKKGQNLLIIGRNQEKLSNVSNEIQSQYNDITVETLQIDLSKLDETAQQNYVNAIEKKDVGILINNAGLSYKYVTYFDEVDQNHLENMVYVNNLSPTILIHRTLPFFLKKDKSKNSAIINISSAGAIFPHELHAVYSATKSYLNKITGDLSLEYKRKGIYIQSQMPYFVCSKMSRIRRPSLTTPTAEDYAVAAVKQIGYSGIISPYPMHALIFYIISFLPAFILEKVIGSMHHSVRKRALKKLEEKKSK